MSRLQNTYLQYGVSSDLAVEFESMGLSATTFRTTSIKNLVEKYGIRKVTAERVKKCLTREPIDEAIVQLLLERSNFVCCCCKGTKGYSYIIHHITPYEETQDNGYDNLAVLCPNDHDLAHRTGVLTLNLTKDQVRTCKRNWEEQVRVNNLAVSIKEREELLRQVPRYQRLEQELADLRARMAEKDKLLTRSEGFFEAEREKLSGQINGLQAQKRQLEDQVESMAARLSSVDLSKASEAQREAVRRFLIADIAGAIEALNDAELDAELVKAEQLRHEANEAICKNADGRLLRAELLTLEGRNGEARQSSDAALKLYDTLAEADLGRYGSALAWGLEVAGSVLYASGDFEAALSCFNQGLEWCQRIEQRERQTLLPLRAVLIQNVGACHYRLGDLPRTLALIEEAVSLFAAVREAHFHLQVSSLFIARRHAAALTNLGIAYTQAGRPREAIEPLLAAEALLNSLPEKESYVHRQGAAINLISLSNAFSKLADWESAKRVNALLLPLMQGLVRKENLDEQLALGEVLHNLGSSHFKANDFESAFHYCGETVKHFRGLIAAAPDIAEMRIAGSLLCRSFILSTNPEYHRMAAEEAQEAKSLAEKHATAPEARSFVKEADQVLAYLKSAEKAGSDFDPCI